MRHFLAKREGPDLVAKREGPDLVVAGIAARQHGIVSVEQLYAAGLSRSAVKRRVSNGRLHRVHRGVYAVGHVAIGNEGRWMAAVLACGPCSALSHRSAAELWGLLTPGPGPVHVINSSSAGRRPGRGICLHRSSSLSDGETTLRNGIAVTTPARTIEDLRRTAPVDDVRRAVREAEFRRFELGGVANQVGELTRSALERRFLRLCRDHRLPEPEVNPHVGPFEVDFAWRDQRLVVETDGWRSHGTRTSFESDRARDLELRLLGFYVVRLTYRQVTEQPAATAAKLRTLLSRSLRPMAS